MPVVIFIVVIAVLGMIMQAVEAIWAAWNWGIFVVVIVIVFVGTAIVLAIVDRSKQSPAKDINLQNIIGNEWRDRALAAEAQLGQRSGADTGEWMDRAFAAERMLESIEEQVVNATKAAEARMVAFERRAEAADHQAAMIGERCIMLEQKLAMERQANLEAKSQHVQHVLAPEKIKWMLVQCHPDKHGGSKLATEVTQWLISMRKKG